MNDDRERMLPSPALLGELLRRGDPLDGEAAPDAAECARLRARIVAESRSGRRHRAGAPAAWPASAAVVAALALAAVLGWAAWPQVSPPPWWAVAPRPGVAIPPDGRQARQLQFDTPGGTRVVWILDPDADFDSDFDASAWRRAGRPGRSKRTRGE